MFLTRIITTALIGLAAAVAAPAAFAMPDRAPVPAAAGQDLRGPDARPAPPIVQDVRSPKTGDAVVPSADSAVSVSGADSPWLEAGLAAALAVSLICLGIATVRRRSPAASA